MTDGPGEILTLDLTDKRWPRFSPDGSQVSFTAFDTLRDCEALYKLTGLGNEPIPLTQPDDSTTYEDPVWSPDGCWLAASGDSGLYRLAADGSQKFLLASGQVSDARWSDNEWLVYTKWDTVVNVHRLYKVRTDGTEETCLTPDADGYLQPRPLSQNEAVCVKLKDEVYQVCRVSPGGQESWLSSDYMQNSDVQISPDGQWVTYEKLDESGYWQVYKMRVDGSEEMRLSDGTCPCLTPVFSPDGQNVAYTK
jgi:Tol biopolymer transport system component